MKKLLKGLGLGFLALALVVGAGAGSASATLTVGSVTMDTAAADAFILGGSNTTGSITLGSTSHTGATTVSSGNITGATTASAFPILANAVTTGTGAYLVANGLTEGSGMIITSTGTVVTTGNLLTLTGNSATTAAGLLRVNGNGLTSGIGQVITSSSTGLTGAGRLLRVDHTGASTSGATSKIAEIASAATEDTTILAVTASGALAAGVVADLSAAALTTGKVVDISDLDAITTGKAIHVDATGVTQTSGILVHVDSASTALTGAGRLLLVDHTGATGDASGIVAEFKTAATDETTVVKVTSAAMIDGVNLLVEGTTGMTTGSLIRATSSTAGAVATNGIISLVASGAYTSTSNAGFVNITANSTLTGTVLAVNATALTTGIGIYSPSAEAGLTGAGRYMSLGGGVFSVAKFGATVITGTAEGTAALTLTTGDITITDGDLNVTAGEVNITAGSSIVSSVSNLTVPFIPAVVQQALSGAGAINITTYFTAWTTTAGDAGTLADSTVKGQLKKVQLIVDGGDGTLTIAQGGAADDTIVFADAGDYALLMWNGTAWVPVELGNDADGATKPVFTDN